MANPPPGPPRRARLRPRDHSRYPAAYHRTWFRVVDRHPDPGVATMPGYIWIDVRGKVQSVWALHFEIAEGESPG